MLGGFFYFFSALTANTAMTKVQFRQDIPWPQLRFAVTTMCLPFAPRRSHNKKCIQKFTSLNEVISKFYPINVKHWKKNL